MSDGAPGQESETWTDVEGGKVCLIICSAVETKMSRRERVAGSRSCCAAAIELLFLELFHFFSSNIYLMINPQLAPGRSEFCWLCSSS